MPIITRCPDCKRQVRVRDDQLGKQVRCPGCKEVFTAEEDEDEAPARLRVDAIGDRSIVKKPKKDYEDVEEDDRPRRRRDDDDEDDEEEEEDRPKKKVSARQGYKKVLLGLTLYLAAIFVALGGSLVIILTLMVVVGMTAATKSISTATGGVIVVACLALLVAVAWRALWTGGMVLCMFVPNKPDTSLRLLGILSLCLCGANTLFYVLHMFVGLLSAGMGAFASTTPLSAGEEIDVAQVVLWILSLLCMAGWFIVFILLLRAIALDLRQYELAATLMKYLISVAVFIGVSMVMIPISLALGGVLGASSSSGGFAAAGILFLLVFSAVFITSICLGIWHIVLVFQVRTVVDRRVNR
jgi:predicted Zn finger-like uncharacterized protein